MTGQTAVSPKLLSQLQALCPNGVYANVDLAKVSRWRIGGIADCVVAPSSFHEVVAAVSLLREHGASLVVLGSTTNVLFSDEGLRAVGIHIGTRMSGMQITDEDVQCEAGMYVPRFARRVGQAGFKGAEHLSGIPGTLGGLICMNGGTQRRGIGENVVEVTAVNESGSLIKRDHTSCGFAYRTSAFQHNNDIILSARFRFPERDIPVAIRSRMLAVLRERRRKFPQKLPNCGSTFVSDPAMYAQLGPPGAVIERLGFKGAREGGAMVSPLHANFIINSGGATARDVLTLVRRIKDRVRSETGHLMRVEAKFVSPEGSVRELC